MLPLEGLIRLLKKLLPQKLVGALLPVYHYLWSLLPALWYRFPARSLNVVVITGTKGKTTTAELVANVLEEANFKVALAGTLKFKIADSVRRNPYKMTVPGRGVIQKFLHDAKKAGCDWVVLEMTSQAAAQFRHLFLFPNAFIFTNLEPEHIESHGSYHKYLNSKLDIARQLARSGKPNKAAVINIDDDEGVLFFKAVSDSEQFPYNLETLESFELKENGTIFIYKGIEFFSPLIGKFNLYNLLATLRFAESQDISFETVVKAFDGMEGVRGRLEKVENDKNIDVYVDYAHTPHSLESVYEAFSHRPKICVLGNTGGGRDTWKRPQMAKIAENHCDFIYLTDEDPYDEEPREIVEQMAAAIENKSRLEIEMDRRIAIRKALQRATPADVVLITGKGTDPYIMRANGEREPWDDVTVVREELSKLD